MIWLVCCTVILFETALSAAVPDAEDGSLVLQDCASDDTIKQLTDKVNSLVAASGSSSAVGSASTKTNLDLTRVGDGYYYISSKAVTWGNAFKFCKKHNLNLISFETEKEIKTMVDFLKKNGNSDRGQEVDSFWTSAIDLGLSSQFYWTSSGEPVDTNEITWWPTEPLANRHAALFNYIHPSHLQYKYTMFTRAHNLAFKFICEV